MSRFKQVWLSFWRKDQGLGMMETALFLPIFLMFAFAVMDFGNYLIVKNRIVSANQAIASAIQNNPTISNSDLQTVIQNSLGNLWFNASGGYIGHTGIAIWASKTPPSLSTAPTGPDIWGIKDLTNPWLSDTDPSNDNNAYYIGVRVWRGVPLLTPLPKLLNLAVGDRDNKEGTAPHGRKNTDSFTFVTLNNASCPADQVLQSMTGGAANCVPRDRNYSCASGQTLEKIVDGNPVCVAKDGEYTCASGQVLKEVKNGAAVCVDRDAQYECGEGQVLKNVNNGSATCVDMDKAYTCTGDQVLQATSAGGAVCVDKDRGGLSCASGQVVTAVTNGVPTCGTLNNAQIISISECPEGQYMTGIRNNLPICRASKFGGIYNKGLGHRCVVPNEVTGDCTCPSWAPTQQIVSEFYNGKPHVYQNTYYCNYSDSKGPDTTCGYQAIVCLP
jgi:hypothetical protein